MENKSNNDGKIMVLTHRQHVRMAELFEQQPTTKLHISPCLHFTGVDSEIVMRSLNGHVLQSCCFANHKDTAICCMFWEIADVFFGSAYFLCVIALGTG